MIEYKYDQFSDVVDTALCTGFKNYRDTTAIRFKKMTKCITCNVFCTTQSKATGRFVIFNFLI